LRCDEADEADAAARLALLPGPTSDSQLENWLRRFMPERTYAGLLSGDQGALMGSQRGVGYLVNLDSTPGKASYGGGTHWCSAFAFRSPPAVIGWYDSLGNPPPQSFTNQARKTNRCILSNNARDQRYDSQGDAQCGQRAVFALKTMAEKGIAGFEELLGGLPARVRG